MAVLRNCNLLKLLSRFDVQNQSPTETKYSKHPLIRKNKRTCLAKHNQAGSYMWVTVKL